jgi:hypothetical protein
MSMFACWSIKIQVMNCICIEGSFLKIPLSIMPNTRAGEIGTNMRSSHLQILINFHVIQKLHTRSEKNQCDNCEAL